MKTHLQIILLQSLPDIVRRVQKSILATKQCALNENAFKRVSEKALINNSNKRALISFNPNVLEKAKSEWPNIRYYNNTGLVYSLVQSLHKSGFLVDMVNPDHGGYKIRDYDIFIGHGSQCGWILDQLDTKTTVYEYVSGAYWEAFLSESNSRYKRFYNKLSKTPPKDHRRSMRGLCEGHEKLHDRAHVMFTIQCPRMIANYGKFSEKFHFTGLGAYLDPLFVIPEESKDYENGRNNFIYVGGTGGNIQKGLDVLLEAFATTPNLNLFIYSKVEPEILYGCRRELSLSNVHYIYHWRFRPFSNRLRNLLKNINFTIHAPINFGTGTAFMASMGSGLIPCGYVDMPPPLDGTVLTDDWSPEALTQCILEASDKDAKWCQIASKIAKERYHKHCAPDVVEANFEVMFSSR